MQPAKQPTFFTLVKSTQEEKAASILIKSLRAFGGEWRDAEILVFLLPGYKHSSDFPAGDAIQTRQLDFDPEEFPYFFGTKVLAASQAETLCVDRTDSLIWVNPMTMILQSPQELILDVDTSAAFRPVHIRNIGNLWSEALDPFWQAVYEAVDSEKSLYSITSFIGDQELHPYLNSHLYAIDPRLGILKKWEEIFKQLVKDPGFQSAYCEDIPHQVFLHQAVLSALISKNISRKKLRIISPLNSYPLHLHHKIPLDKQVSRLDELITPVYEDELLYPETFAGLEIDDDLRDWVRKAL